MGVDVATFIQRWKGSEGSERSNKDSFLSELCGALGVPAPGPRTTSTTEAPGNGYVFEGDVDIHEADGRVHTKRMDLYKHAHFILEAKQFKSETSRSGRGARRGSPAWEREMNDAYGQVLGYARGVKPSVPVLLVCDIGYCFDLYACLDGSSHYRPFPSQGANRVYLSQLERHLPLLRAVFTDPESLSALCPTSERRADEEGSRDVLPLAEQPIAGNRPGPFEAGSAVPAERFRGRRGQIADVQARIGGISAQSISLVGLRRSGKSSLFRYITERIHDFCPPEQRPIVVSLDLQARRFHEPAGLIEGLRRRIEETTGASPWRSEHNEEPFAVDDGLAALRDRGFRLLVLLDEFERISARLDRFQDWGEDWRSKASAGYFALCVATTRPLIDVYERCHLTSPFGNIFSTTTLGGLTVEEAAALVQAGFERGGVTPAETDMRLIEELAGTLPYYLQLAASLLWQHRHHDATRRAFEEQTTDRFRELWASLTGAEQQALRQAGRGGSRASSAAATVEILVRHGLLRPDGRPFSSPFASFVRGAP